MPQVGWDIDGVIYTLDEVEALARTGNWIGDRWPAQVLQRLADRTRDWHRLRASQLGSCIRASVLKAHEPYVLRPDDCWSRAIGSAFHQLMDGESTDRILREVRMSVPLEVAGESLLLSGQIDYYDRQTRILDDYKLTGSVYRKDLTWSYELQQNIYVHLLREQGEEPTRSRLWYAEFKPVQDQKRKQKVLKIKGFEVPIWSRENLLEVVQQSAELIVRAHRDGYLPPRFAADDSEAYQCRFCPVNQRCLELMQQDI